MENEKFKDKYNEFKTLFSKNPNDELDFKLKEFKKKMDLLKKNKMDLLKKNKIDLLNNKFYSLQLNKDHPRKKQNISDEDSEYINSDDEDSEYINSDDEDSELTKGNIKQKIQYHDDKD